MKVKFKEDKGQFKKDKAYEVLTQSNNEIIIKGEDTYNYWVQLDDVEVIEPELLEFARRQAQLYQELERYPETWKEVLSGDETKTDWAFAELFTLCKMINEYFDKEGY